MRFKKTSKKWKVISDVIKRLKRLWMIGISMLLLLRITMLLFLGIPMFLLLGIAVLLIIIRTYEYWIRSKSHWMNSSIGFWCLHEISKLTRFVFMVKSWPVQYRLYWELQERYQGRDMYHRERGGRRCSSNRSEDAFYATLNPSIYNEGSTSKINEKVTESSVGEQQADE